MSPGVQKILGKLKQVRACPTQCAKLADLLVGFPATSSKDEHTKEGERLLFIKGEHVRLCDFCEF